MIRLSARLRRAVAHALLVGVASAWSAHAYARIADHRAFLDQTEGVRTSDHPLFVKRMAQIHAEASTWPPAARWRVRYLDAWETMFGGDYATSEGELRAVIAHSGDAVLVTKASALLLNNLTFNRRYEEAFTLANQLTATVPSVTDAVARSMLLGNLSQMMNFAGQPDLAISYADMLENGTPTGASVCYPRLLRVTALYNKKQLTSTDLNLAQAIDTCVADGQSVLANTLWLVRGDVLLDEKRPRDALAMLDRIEPGIRTSQYFAHIVSSQVERAKAYAALGDIDKAKAAALAAIATGREQDLREWLKDAYEVMYRLEKGRGNAAAALPWFEAFVEQDKDNLNDTAARSVAYALSKQHNLVLSLETERLAKQNSILQLQRALDTKAVETGRLYIALLSVLLLSIIFWVFRLKRSQMRFRKLANEDSLTGISNHQHFMSEAERMLRVLEKRGIHACLISIDLDHFKQVNDTHGHAMGDAVLRYTAVLCSQQLRPVDLFGRLGGEEFGILIPDCSCEQGLIVADRIRIALQAAPVVEGDVVVSFSTSAGLACTERSGHDLKQLCRDADAALYRAKRGGRNRVVVQDRSESFVPM